MNQPKILLFKGKKDLVGKSIMYFTHSPYTHTAIYLNGFTFESTVWMLPEMYFFGKFYPSKWWMFWLYRSGIRMTVGQLPSDKVYDFHFEIPDSQCLAMAVAASTEVNEKRSYNYLMTFFDMLIYPTRWFWQKIKWIPFSSRYLGKNCSWFVDHIVKRGGIDLWPGRDESTTVPGDYPGNQMLYEELP